MSKSEIEHDVPCGHVQMRACKRAKCLFSPPTVRQARVPNIRWKFPRRVHNNRNSIRRAFSALWFRSRRIRCLAWQNENKLIFSSSRAGWTTLLCATRDPWFDFDHRHPRPAHAINAAGATSFPFNAESARRANQLLVEQLRLMIARARINGERSPLKALDCISQPTINFAPEESYDVALRVRWFSLVKVNSIRSDIKSVYVLLAKKSSKKTKCGRRHNAIKTNDKWQQLVYSK